MKQRNRWAAASIVDDVNPQGEPIASNMKQRNHRWTASVVLTILLSFGWAAASIVDDVNPQGEPIALSEIYDDPDPVCTFTDGPDVISNCEKVTLTVDGRTLTSTLRVGVYERSDQLEQALDDLWSWDKDVVIVPMDLRGAMTASACDDWDDCQDAVKKACEAIGSTVQSATVVVNLQKCTGRCASQINVEVSCPTAPDPGPAPTPGAPSRH